MNMLKTKRGFTLIELMIVVAIIGILAAIAIPQFASLVAKSQEGATKGNLGTLRSALSIYYGDTEGWYPTGSSWAELTTSQKYIAVVPSANMPKTINNAGHGSTSAVVTTLADSGGWYFNNTQANTNWGQTLVNCSHQDVRGQQWTSY